MGASLVVAATLLLFVVARRLGHVLPNAFGWQQLTAAQVLLGAAAGAYSHIVLDSIMHADMAPLAPFAQRKCAFGYYFAREPALALRD